MPAAAKRWSQRVTQTSDALDLEHGVFAATDPKAIAASLKRSAERSRRRKGSPYRSAISMLSFYINRAGSTLEPVQRRRLEAAKDELRVLFKRRGGDERVAASQPQRGWWCADAIRAPAEPRA